MYKPGAWFVADEQLRARGIETRADLDRRCHRELRQEINTYLWWQSISSPLHLAAVNPDGERRRSLDVLCYWHPRHLAQELIARLENPEPDSPEEKFREYSGYLRGFRQAAAGRAAEAREKAKRARAREEALERMQMKIKGC